MISFDIGLKLSIDPDTGEYKVTLGGIEYSGTAKSAKSTTTTKKKESKPASPENNPGIIREDTKLVLSAETAEMMGVEAGTRLSVNYDRKGSGFVPFIMIDDKKGNKLTEKLTVSYRGKSNEELSRYGTLFKLEEGKLKGSYYLIGDKEAPQETKTTQSDEIQLDDDFELELELDMTETKQVTTFNFSDIDLA